ncbi:hypothetical protein SAMN04487761_11469 [Lachnospiraceae bacterium C7]|nr:hypothetical protein SAMN04487761_11469 [Lachnospiraceae bacterium C7]
MRISKYTILKYVCVISLELILVACIYNSEYRAYMNKKESSIAIKKQLSLAEKDKVIEKKQGESLKQAFENRIQKDEFVKKTTGKYECKFISGCKFPRNVYFTKYNVYNKKTNKKVGEGFIAPVNEKIGGECLERYVSDYSQYVSYIVYIKVFNPDNIEENYEVKEPGYFTEVCFKKVEEKK